MATDLGKAYVQIMPSAKGISGSIQKAINPEATAAGKSAGRNIASSIASTLGGLGDTLTKKVTLPALGAVTAVGGLVGALGFKRLVGMDNAQAKLVGLGYTAKDIDNILKTVNESVTGTTHTMAEGTDVAAGALAAGVKEGKELERYITLVGDAATGANRPMDEMAMIINRVQGSGRLMTQELNMIEMGMPGFAQAMADNLADGSMEAFREMVTNGEVGSDEFLDVMEDFAGGMSDAFANTWSGMAKNVLSNIGILGERALEGLFGDGKKAMSDFLDVLRSDDLRNWAEETGESIREFVHSTIEKIMELKELWDSLSPTVQEVAKKVAVFGSIGIIALGPILKILTPIVSAIGALIPVLGALFSPMGLIIGAIAAFAAGLVYLWQTNEDFREFVVELWENIKETFFTVLDDAVTFAKDIWGGLVEWWQEHNEMILEAFENLVGFIQNLMEFIWPFVENMVMDTWNAVKNIIQGGIDVITGIIQGFSALLTGDWDALWESIKKVLSGVLQSLWGLIDLWFIVKTLGLGRTFIDTFKGIFKGGWDFIKGIFTGGIDAIRNTTNAGLNTVKNIISNILNGIKNTFSNIFGGFRNIVSTSLNGVRTAVSNGINRALNVVTNFRQRFLNAGRNIVTAIADGIKGAISSVTDAISNVTSKVRDFLPFSPPKEGKLKDIMDVDWGGTIAGGIEKGESVVAEAMDDMLAFDLTQKAQFSNPNKMNNAEDVLASSEQKKPIILQVDGKTFAQIMGDYTSEEGGNRIRKIERGLA